MRPGKPATGMGGAPRVAAAALALAVGVGAAHAGPACDLDGGAPRIVAKVEAADTLLLDDGREAILTGALPPGAGLRADGDPASWPPLEQSRRALDALVAGRSVEIAGSGRRIDRYGRELGQIFTERDGQRIWVQGHLIERGLARAYGLPGNLDCLGPMIALEETARDARRGHWGNRVFQDRDASDVRGVSAYRDTFQTLEGRVARAGRVRGRLSIVFEPGDKDSVTANMEGGGGSRGARRAAADASTQLAGRRIRVRGWVEIVRGRPVVTLFDNSMIEVIEGGVPAPGAAAPDRQPPGSISEAPVPIPAATR